MLARIGNYTEADAIFQEGMNDKWDEAWGFYYQSLSERKDFTTLAAKIYHDTLNPGYRSRKDLTYFAENLRKLKLENPYASAQEKVLPLLKDLEDYPQAKEIAQALCKITDWEFEPAIQQLQGVKESLEELKAGDAILSEADSFYEEDKHIDLYLCLALLYEGRDYEAARAAFQEFYNKNTDDYKYIYDKGLWLAYQFEHGENMPPKIVEITTFLVNSDLVNNDEIKAQFTEENMAHLWNMHQMGLFFAGRYNEAMDICKFIYDNYFPHTSAGTHSAAAWGNHLAGELRFEEAEPVFERILAETPYQDITPWTKLSLAQVKRSKGDLFEALNLVSEVIHSTDGSEDAHFKICFDQAKQFEREVLRQLKREDR